MKKLAFLLLVGLVFISCKSEPKIDYVLFSGEIENAKDQRVTIYKGREKVKEVAVSENGTFSDTLRIDSGYYTFSHGRENSAIYLSPGNSLKVVLNTEEFDESITYSGEGSENNNFLASKYLADEELTGDYSEFFSLEEADFLAKLNTIKAAKDKLLADAGNIDSDFKSLEKKNLEFEYLSSLQSYAPAHKYYAKKDEFEVSKDFMKPLESIDYTNAEDYKSLSTYKQLVQGYYSNKIRESENPSEVFDDINKNGSTALKTDLSKMLNYEVAPNNEHNEAYYNGLLAMSNDAAFKEKLTTKYNKVKTLAKGMPSPTFVDYENHKGGKTSLNDLKGKYVYVDVWATWCGPCKREIPYLKEVEKEFHGKNIEFVSTSIDKVKDHGTWVEMVKEKELGGMQLFADSDWKSKFVTDYAIEGIPRFLLIDPEGNIVSADAPRPSDPKLVELFKELKL